LGGEAPKRRSRKTDADIVVAATSVSEVHTKAEPQSEPGARGAAEGSTDAQVGRYRSSRDEQHLRRLLAWRNDRRSVRLKRLMR
jgi:hypothetical protein